MPTVYALIAPKQQWEDANGNPLSGYKLFVYTAGTTTKETTYQDAAGTTPNSNPIVLNSLGQCTAGLYTTTGLKKLVMAPPTDTDPPSSPLWTFDNIRAPNDISTTIDQWVLGTTPTYINSTQFSVVGDQRTTYQVGRRIQAAVTAGTVYGRISASAFASVTTVTVVLDSGALDSGLSAVSYGLISATNTSVPLLTDARPSFMNEADKTKLVQDSAAALTSGATRTRTMQDRNITIADILDNHGQCRLTFQSSTQVRLIPYNGSRIVINGSIQIIPSAGVNLSNSGLTAATLYYIYAYMSAGVMTLEASATTHATDTTTGVEIKNGDATRTLVGMVYMGAGSPGTFVDSVTQRFVASWFNRRERELYASANPGTKTNTSVGELNASLQLQFVTWADEAWDARTFGTMYLVTSAVTSTTYLSFGIDSTSASTAGTEIYLQQNGTTFSTPTPAGTQVSRTSSEGFHFVTPLNRVSGNTHTYDVFNAVAGVRI